MKIKYHELESFLSNLKKDDFGKKIIPAKTRNDIDRFRLTVRQDETVEYGQPFLVDLIGNDLSVCILTKRKYKTQTGRLVSCRLDKTIIQDCREIYGTPINGYWIIPKEFLQ